MFVEGLRSLGESETTGSKALLLKLLCQAIVRPSGAGGRQKIRAFSAVEPITCVGMHVLSNAGKV